MNLSSSSSLKDEENLSSNGRYYFGPSRLLTKRIRLKSNDGTLDFTINGGNHLQPIQIASVVWNSQAYLQGMRPGDQIISVNGIDFERQINYTQALQVNFFLK
jgi:C-terminal processing protease CtpA/Prc